ncbi:transcription factor MYB33 [Lathyrus oleraceus]|nr:transcription factor MYB33-like [Pisum sativum]KAI5411407.1 Transcription regulatory protein SNF2, variant 2 [Pisum sativum]
MKDSRAVLSGEEADQRDNAGGGEVALKKGPWTKEEDEILVDHIKKHGEGNWNAVQKESGLARCGKSCRLRWFNHLRPGLKRGPFTAEEERKILEFHFRKGSKWAQMAALLPGRTDNEIKNFWYARSKKRQRAGLPIYPEEITSKPAINGSQESAEALANESSQQVETETFNLDITDLDLKYYKFSPDMLPPFFDIQDYKPISDLVGRYSDPSHNTLSMPSAVVQRRYLFSGSSAADPEVFDQYSQYAMLSTPCDPILDTNLVHGYDNPIPGFHAKSNISYPEPIYGSMRFEPPSFQNLPQQCNWPQLPSLEYVDMSVPCPPIDPIDKSILFPSINPVDKSTLSPSINPVDKSIPSPSIVDKSVPSPPIDPCPSVPDYPDCNHFIDSIVNFNSDQNLKGSNIDSLQTNTDNKAPNEADTSTKWNRQDYDQHTAIVTLDYDQHTDIVSRQINFLKRVRSKIKNRGSFNRLPAYYTSNNEYNLNRKDLVLPDAVMDYGWY